MSLAIGLLIGVMVGVLLSRFIFKEKPVGSLRVDESDPDSGPYLFLELDRSGADAIYKQRYVRLRVELVVNCMNLNIRKDPTQVSRSLDIISSDTVVTVCDNESVSGFYKVKTGDGISGYCMSEFIKLC